MKPAGSWQACWLPHWRFSFNLRIIQETSRFISYDRLSEKVQMIICCVKELTTVPYMIITLSSISILSIMCWQVWSTVRLLLVIVWLWSKFKLCSCLYSQMTTAQPPAPVSQCPHCMILQTSAASVVFIWFPIILQLPLLIFSVGGTIWCYSSTSGDPLLHFEAF
jgi:hypothetical protein